MQTVNFKAGDTILSQGEEGNTAFLITSGTVEVIIGAGADAKRVGALDAGEVFGEMSLIEPGPRSATIIAQTDTECVMTSYDEFITSIQENPERAVEFMKTMVRRLRHMNDLMATMDPRKRRLSDVIRDWQKSAARREANMSDAERRVFYATMYLGM